MSRKIFGLQSIEEKLSYLLKPIFQGSKKEFILINNLVKNWEEIVGKKYAKLCYPKSVNFSKEKLGKLTIAVHNSAVGFFLESNSDIILERIASFYGFKSIAKIIIAQEPKDLDLSVTKEIKLPKEKEEFLERSLDKIEDKDLAETLKKIGREILATDKS